MGGWGGGRTLSASACTADGARWPAVSVAEQQVATLSSVLALPLLGASPVQEPYLPCKSPASAGGAPTYI